MNQLLRYASRIQADHVFIAISGCISLSTSFQFYKSEYARTYSNFTVGEHQYNYIILATLCVTIIGVVNIFIAAARYNGYCRFNFNKYVISLVTSLMCNFALGILLTDYKGQLPDILDKTMKPKLYNSLLSQLNFGVGFSESESWDFMQLQMKCCGVESYRDYLIKQLATNPQVVPMSCCMMKPQPDELGQPVAANPSQCMLDAKHKATESIFLHVQGCKGPLARWLIWHISRLTAMLFASICLQAVTLLYLSYQGFQTLPTKR